ncbi:hypothetical protein C2G38_2165487 [Gigaspora rosea]|uniref:TLDc domain-containing protein n=1 Tax=Gigaspora rosea TaxID=44941 RepID=A0A397VSR1_9GLOM|nr:hypothetical protein C2G38_2165487 [Gigaspora rosea]
MTAKHLEKLSIDYLELLNDKEDFNVIINVGESANTKIFRAHSNVLRYRSLYFQDKLANTSKEYPNKIFDSEDFTSLQENALVSLIKRDDLQMEEIKIWNYIIKWEIAQNPELSSGGPENWTRKLSGIKKYRNLWNDIKKIAVNSSRKISSIILPPRTILTPTLPTRITRSFSTIINEAHAAEIATWIDKKIEMYSITDNPFKFKLLLRGTRDGFTTDTFWKICNKRENTIVVMKVKDTDEILGGYNPIQWDSAINGFVSCKDSFIFSLKNGNINSSTLSRVEDECCAIYCNSRFGPTFGAEYEVFQIEEKFNL